MPADRKKLLGGAAVAGAAGIGAVAIQAKKDTLAKAAAKKSKVSDLEKRQARLKATREHAQVPKKVDPKAKRQREMTPRARREQRKAAQGSRLAKRAAKASKRGLGGKVPKMGAMGLAAGGLGAVMDSRAIDKEGGRFIARFGKFVERTLGLPAGTTGRPQTEQEHRASTTY